jgi:TRAP-type uncharacterized transport system fused permease subunit
MAAFVEVLSGGVFFFMLVFVALISLILGMGLPTTANYIVVSSLMASVVVELGAQSGMIVPLIAVHLFVFYFGIMADVTPPVGLASFAAAAISGASPIKTGVTAFFYSLRTVALPFLFIYNTDLLLINVDLWHGILVFVVATAAMLLFAAGTQGYFVVKSRLWESLALILIAFTLFRPGFWLDLIEPPHRQVEPTTIYEVVDDKPENAQIRMVLEGEDIFSGKLEQRTVLLPLGATGRSAIERLRDDAGIEFRIEEGKLLVDNIVFGKPAEKNSLDFDWQVLSIEKDNERMDKEWFWIPAFVLFLLILLVQRRRASKQQNAQGAAA